MAEQAVEIAGVGLVTPLGVGAWPNFAALLKGRRITDVAAGFLDTIPAGDFVRGVGGVSAATHGARGPVVELAERAAREAIDESGLEAWGLPLALGCSKGAVGMAGPFASAIPEAVAMGPHQFVASELQRRLSVEPRGCFVAACASGLVGLEAAWRWIRSGRCRAAVVVSAEAALDDLHVASYRRLGVLAEPTPEGYRQRPLDRRRAGFVLGAMGAAVVLRTVDPADRTDPAGERSSRPRLEAVASASAAFDMVRTDPSMAATRAAVRRAVGGRAVDVVHPHAPGTRDHDGAELRAIADELTGVSDPLHAASPVSVYANKGAIGHGLGASGLASLVLAVLMRRTGKRPPMPWLTEPEPGLGLPIDAAAGDLSRDGRHLVLASGFGGVAAAAVVA